MVFTVVYGLVLISLDWIHIYLLDHYEKKWSAGTSWAVSLVLLPFLALLSGMLFTCGAALAGREREVPLRGALAGVALAGFMFAAPELGAWLTLPLLVACPFAAGYLVARSSGSSADAR